LYSLTEHGERGGQGYRRGPQGPAMSPLYLWDNALYFPIPLIFGWDQTTQTTNVSYGESRNGR
jgi:hypothetical protein